MDPLSVAASIVGLISALHKQLDMLKEQPEAYPRLEPQLSTLLEIFQRIESMVHDGVTQNQTVLGQDIIPIFTGCIIQVSELTDIMKKTLPAPNDSFSTKSTKALRRVGSEAKVQKISTAIQGHIQTLKMFIEVITVSNTSKNGDHVDSTDMPKPTLYPESIERIAQERMNPDRKPDNDNSAYSLESIAAAAQVIRSFLSHEWTHDNRLDEEAFPNKVLELDPAPQIHFGEKGTSRVPVNVRFEDPPRRDFEVDAENDTEPSYDPVIDLAGDQDSESDSLSSSDSRFSWGIASDASTAPTETEVAVTNIEEIVITFINSLFENKRVFEAMWFVLSNCSTLALESQIRALLKQFVGALHDEPHLPGHDMSSIFRGRSHSISRRIALWVQAEGQIRGLEQGGSDDKEQDLKIGANGDQGADDSDQEDQEDQEVDDSDKDDDDEALGADNIDVLEFRGFICSSPAFQLFLSDIYNLAFPSLKKKLERLLGRWKQKGKHADCTTQVEMIVAELAYSQPNVITIIQQPPGWGNQLKESIEEYTGEPWD